MSVREFKTNEIVTIKLRLYYIFCLVSLFPSVPPKKNQQNEEEMEEIKQSLHFTSGEISKVANQQSKSQEVRELKLAIKENDKRIGDLATRR